MMRLTEDEIGYFLNRVYKESSGKGFTYKTLVDFINVSPNALIL